MDNPVTIREFETRLKRLSENRGGQGLPRKWRDKHILFKSLALTLDPTREYREKELNDSIKTWLNLVGRHIHIDHVTLRRHLVDEGYVERDDACNAYRPVADAHSEMFEDRISRVDPIQAIADADREKEQRRQEHRSDDNTR